jgi:hypothetical protein
MRRSLIILFLFYSFIVNAIDTNYYVKTGGNDSNTGLSDAQAWLTIAKVNAIAFAADDTVFFNRGDAWYNDEHLVPRSGTSGHPVVYAAYGTGAKPIIRLVESPAGWTVAGNWTQSGDAWYLGIDDSFKRLWFDDVEKKKCETVTVTLDQPWFWQDGNHRLYIYSATNPAVTFTSIVYPGGDYPVYSLGSVDNVSLYMLNIQGGANCIINRGGENWVVDSCKVGLYCGGNGFRAYATDVSNLADGGIIRNCYFDSGDRLVDDYSNNGTEDGINLYFGCNNWLIYNNTMVDWGHKGIYLENLSATYTQDNIKVYNNYMTAPDIEYGGSFGITIFNGSTTQTEIYNNVIYDVPIFNSIEGSNIYFHNNIISKVRGVSFRSSVGSGIEISGYVGDSKNTKIYNNTIANCANFGIRFALPSINGAFVIEHDLIRNNLIYNCDTVYGKYQIWVNSDPQSLDNTWENNIVYTAGETDLIKFKSVDYTVTEFNALNGTNGDVMNDNITGDPLFIDPTNDTLQIGLGSPAIDAALYVGITSDFLGNVVGIYPDTGAIEYGASPPAPPLPVLKRSAGGNLLRSAGGKIIRN